MKGLKHALHLAWAAGTVSANSANVVVNTTSGSLVGLAGDGLNIFKGVPYAQAPTVRNATEFGAVCYQVFDSPVEAEFFGGSALSNQSEDCLFLNVWAPTKKTNVLKPVVVWIYGGSFQFGASSIPTYDGASLAANQDIVVVSFNYRLNVFGFPVARDLPTAQNNLGLLDQEAALQWVQANVGQFGGDRHKVTIMGQSAGAQSVSAALVRHSAEDAPFRAGIMLSGAVAYRSPAANYTPFDAFAQAVGCAQAAGAERLACLRGVPAPLIANVTNAYPSVFGFETLLVDNVTVFADSLERIRRGQFSRTPILIGNMEDDGSIWSLFYASIRAMLLSYVGPAAAASVSDAAVRALYPAAAGDQAVIAAFIRDDHYRCPAALYAGAYVGAGVPHVYRYSYGAVFADLQYVPGLGAWHGSELFALFGTYNASSAMPAERALSSTFQAAIANFVRAPTRAPAAHWRAYAPTNRTRTLAKLAYAGNVAPGDVVADVPSESLDWPCEAMINGFLDPPGTR